MHADAQHALDVTAEQVRAAIDRASRDRYQRRLDAIEQALDDEDRRNPPLVRLGQGAYAREIRA